MASDRRQLNIRMDDESWARLDRLVEAMRAELGLVNLSQSNVVMAGLIELEKRYQPKPKKGQK